ncbi:MAG: amino acid permease [Corynebacterium sp.]|nr:amino acid permease [Corynebacterium sp.]
MNSNEGSERHLKRSLKERHMYMIAIGGSIGTGLFVASGATVAGAGPGGALLAYLLIGCMVFLLMQSLGEMATYLPLAGSFGEYGRRFVSPSFGFAIGWNYWFNWAITVAAELAAAALVMKYWFPNTPGWIWSIIFLILLFGLNALSARAYGEGEFWFAMIKVVVVIFFLVLGILMIFGILGGHSPGFSNWTLAGPDGEKAPFVHGWLGLLSIFMIAGFSFQGTELVAVAAGEAEDPDRTIPKAIRTVFFRILLFYIGAIAIIGFLIPFTDSRLLDSSESNIAIAPFTLVFNNAGILAAAAIMNAVILTSILSAGNSGLYASTRMLYALARSHQAPKFLTYVTPRGVPLNALLVTSAVGALAFISSLIGDGAAYTWLVNASGLAGFITWAGIAWCHYRFRKAFIAQGHDLSQLPFKASWYPFGPILALVMCLIVIIGQNYEALVGNGNFTSLLSAYIGLPLFLLLWLIHKLVTRQPGIKPEDADLSRSLED